MPAIANRFEFFVRKIAFADVARVFFPASRARRADDQRVDSGNRKRKPERRRGRLTERFAQKIEFQLLDSVPVFVMLRICGLRVVPPDGVRDRAFRDNS